MNPLGPEIKDGLARIDARFIWHEIRHVFHFEKGFPFTVKELLLRPGKAVREYLFCDRTRLVKPVVFLIFTSLLFTLLAHAFHLRYSFFDISGIGPLQGMVKAGEISDWSNGHLGYTNLFLGVFVALWVRILYRRQGLNLFEIIVLLCYVLGEAILFLGIIMLFTFFVVKTILLAAIMTSTIAVLVYFFYPIWAIGQFFAEKKILAYLRPAAVYVLGIASYQIFLVALAYFLTFAAT